MLRRGVAGFIVPAIKQKVGDCWRSFDFLAGYLQPYSSLCWRLRILTYSRHVELEAKDEELLESQRACYRLKTSLESEQAQAVSE